LTKNQRDEQIPRRELFGVTISSTTFDRCFEELMRKGLKHLRKSSAAEHRRKSSEKNLIIA
jgi:hypothetical protein